MPRKSTDVAVVEPPAMTEALARVTAQLAEGKLGVSDALREILPAPTPEPAPSRLPMAAEITDEQRAAIRAVSRVFGSVVPDTRRELSAVELERIAAERKVLDVIGKMAAKRILDGIRPALFNHFDVQAEEGDAVPDDVLIDADGHYVLAAIEPVVKEGVKFVRQISEGGPMMGTVAELEELENDPEFAGIFTHEDFLAMTTPVRVIDEAKIMLALREKPELIRVLAKVSEMGRTTASFYMRPL